MKIKSRFVVVILIHALAFSAANAQSDLEWVNIDDPGELRRLLIGRAIDDSGWVDYYRADGNMAYQYFATDTIAIRKWTITDNGELCSAVYSHPDRIIDCFTYQQTSGETKQYRLNSRMGRSAFRFLADPPKKLVDALNEKAGTEL